MPDAVADEPDRFPHFILLAHSKNVLGKLIDQRLFEAFGLNFRVNIRERVILLHGFFSVRFQVNHLAVRVKFFFGTPFRNPQARPERLGSYDTHRSRE